MQLRDRQRRLLGVLIILTILAALGGCKAGLKGATPSERAIEAADLGVNGADEYIPVLLQAIREDQELVQVQAITSLGRIGTPAAVAALAEVAGHESRNCRTAVAQALRDVDPAAYAEAAEVLVAMGAKHLPRGPGKDPDLEIRQAIVTSLAVVKQPAGLEYLVQRLQDDHDETIRNAAVVTLGRLGDARALDTLREVFATDNEENRSWAVESIGKIGDASGLDVIEQALTDYDPVCRGKAAWALMQIRGDEARPVLEQALEGEEDDMPAIVMAHALTLLGDERTVPFLEERAQFAASNFARAEATRVLGEVGRPETIPVLDKIFNEDRDGLVKREASVAIRKLIPKYMKPDANPEG